MITILGTYSIFKLCHFWTVTKMEMFSNFPQLQQVLKTFAVWVNESALWRELMANVVGGQTGLYHPPDKLLEVLLALSALPVPQWLDYGQVHLGFSDLQFAHLIDFVVRFITVL